MGLQILAGVMTLLLRSIHPQKNMCTICALVSAASGFQFLVTHFILGPFRLASLLLQPMSINAVDMITDEPAGGSQGMHN